MSWPTSNASDDRTQLSLWLRDARQLNDENRSAWLEAGCAWLFRDDGARFEKNLLLLINEFEISTDVADITLQEIRNALLRLEWTDAFIETSFSRRRNFWSAFIDRSLRPLLPETYSDADIRPLVHHTFNQLHLEQLAKLHPDFWHQHINRLNKVWHSDQRIHLHFRKNIYDALLVLSCRLSSALADEDFRRFHKVSDIFNSPFYQLQVCLSDLLNDGDSQTLSQTAKTLIKNCEIEIRDILAELEQSGVSLDLVYLIAMLEATLRRIKTLLNVLWIDSADQVSAVVFLAQDLIQEQIDSRSLRRFLSQQLDVLLRRVVERVGVSGEHYIGHSRKEYFALFKAGLGGGAITSFTSLFKGLIGHLGLPLFFEGAFSWINYSGSFLIMHFNHFALASKQPATTAPALAAKLKNLQKQSQLYEFVQEVAGLTRSQLATTAGNLGMVIPVGFLLDAVYSWYTGHHLYTVDYSEKVFNSFHPFTSWTILFAALTGVILWLSSLLAGAIENWSVYRHIPKGIAHHRGLQKLIGTERTHRFGHWFGRQIAGIASCLTIGFLLAFLPIFGRFFGLGLEVRHVTLSAGQWSIAFMSSFGRLVDTEQIWMALLGVLIIGALNIGVSFSLALFVAIRARRLRSRWLRALWEAVYVHIRVRPLDFFFPPRRN